MPLLTTLLPYYLPTTLLPYYPTTLLPYYRLPTTDYRLATTCLLPRTSEIEISSQVSGTDCLSRIGGSRAHRPSGGAMVRHLLSETSAVRH